MFNSRLLRSVLLILLPVMAVQGAAALKVGDPAPPLKVAAWVQGEPIADLEAGTAYIVEFWATWCGPCRATIPHLNKLHAKFKDRGLVVIGQDVWERDLAQVPVFVKQMGDNMTYRVATDDVSDGSRGVMAVTWMQAAGRNGIPSAFLVDKQRNIAWIGHPMELTDQVLEQVLAGTYDVKKAAAAEAIRTEHKAEIDGLRQKLTLALRGGKWADAEDALDGIQKLMPDERQNLAAVRVRILINKGDSGTAQALVRELSAEQPKDGQWQNDLAWTIAASEGAQPDDLALAEELARRAHELTGGKQPAYFNTQARIAFRQGNKNRALTCIQQAIDYASGKAKTDFRNALSYYRDGKLPPLRQ